MTVRCVYHRCALWSVVDCVRISKFLAGKVAGALFALGEACEMHRKYLRMPRRRVCNVLRREVWRGEGVRVFLRKCLGAMSIGVHTAFSLLVFVKLFCKF